MASSNNLTKNNTANNYAAVSRYAAATAGSGWGGLPSSLASSIANSATSTGVSKTLADYVKESAWQSSLVQQQQQPTASNTALPWAAAIRAAEQQQQLLQNAAASQSAAAAAISANAFENRSSTIGSWCSPEASSSHRSGWGGDGSLKGDGAPDDGTAIWGNPSVKKTGVDWTEKESLLNPPQVNNNSEKRAPKPEPTISSINGTEAWGAPPSSGLKPARNSQQQSNLSNTSGNTYVTKTTTINNEPLGWGESSSLQGNSESSSPPTNSIWNDLASSSSTASRIDELNKQLESTTIFDTIASSPLIKDGGLASANNMINAGAIGGGLIGSNSLNDLKQMSANFTNDILESSGRSSGGSSLATSNNQQGIAPSRDLLKQMVHQIQLAVQAGHLNAQILNQPMSTPTLQLVYTLLQQIRFMRQLQDIQQRTVSKTNDINPAPNNLDLQINRVQQNISLLQKAITQQQAALTKNEQAANNFSYANISKLSTNMKVPPSNISNGVSQQLQAQASASSSASTSAWLAFNSSDLVSSGWNRISPNVSQQNQQQQQFNSDIIPEYAASRGWRDSSNLSDGGKEGTASVSLAPGTNVKIARPNSASNNLKQMSETSDILSKNQSSFYDWGNESDTLKRNFDPESASGSSFSTSATSGLSSQANPWLFAPTSSSLNASGLDNLIGKSINSGKLDNGNSDKIGGDALNFLRSSNNTQRSSTSLYNDWGGIDSSSLAFNAEPNPIGTKPGTSKANASNAQGARPAPPPGILGGFGPSLFADSASTKTIDESSATAREPAASLWNVPWLD